MTVEEITKFAMQEMGKLAAGVNPTSAEYALGLKRLNTLIPSLQNDSVFLDLQDTASIVLVPGETEYVTKIGTYRVRHFMDPSYNILSREDYDQSTSPTSKRTDVFVEYNYDPPIIQFVVAPDEEAAGTEVFYRCDVLMTDLVSGSTPKLKKNSYEMLILGLAYKLCPAYGINPQVRHGIQQDYMNELNKYKVSQSRRIGDEIVAPVGVV